MCIMFAFIIKYFLQVKCRDRFYIVLNKNSFAPQKHVLLSFLVWTIVVAKIIRPLIWMKQFVFSRPLTTFEERKVQVLMCIRVCSIQISYQISSTLLSIWRKLIFIKIHRFWLGQNDIGPFSYFRYFWLKKTLVFLESHTSR
jgi:hypothetical protein